MSLQVWLPFTGKTDNLGLGNNITLEQTGTTTFSDDGKFGKCKMGGSTITSNRNPMGYEGTICFWIYVDDNYEISNGNCLFGNSPTNAIAGNRKWSLFLFPNRNSLHSWGCQFDDTSNTSNGSWTLNNVIPDGVWTHVTVAHDAQKQYIYINGILKSTISWDSTGNLTFDVNTIIVSPNTGAKFNDFRIYDECLSKEQIHQISQGLILHYPLNSGYGNENLLVNSYNGCNVSYTSSTILDETYCGFKIRYLKYEGTSYQDTIQVLNVTTPKPDTYYTASFWAKGNCNILNFFFPSACINAISSDGHTSSAVDGYCVISLTPEWKRYWVTWKTRSDVSGAKNIVVGRIQNQGTGAECYIAGLKFEEGDKNSIWSPNEADNLYSQLGYDSTTMYDTSGFGNNAEKINTPIYTSDTALYDSCINFNQSGYLKNTSLNLYANELTICFWVKIPSLISSQHFLLGSFNNWTSNGVAMWRDKGSTESEKAGYTIILKSTEESSHLSNFFIDNIPTNSWFFISLVYDGTTVKSYTNGILNKQTTYGNNGQIYNPVLYLGTSLFGNISTETDEASMSDFRIYSTALSAEDIKQLYESKVRIDKNGNVYCNQFVESSDMGNSNVDKKGILHTNSLIEIKSEEKCRIFKQDIQSNEIIEI